MVVACREGLDERLLALTFDDGPGAATKPLLDLLHAHEARATFFVLGQAVAGREEILHRAVVDGHELGNHTFSHTPPEELSDGELREELVRTSELVERVVGVTPLLVRPPYGQNAQRVARIAGALGHGPTVLWSIDPRDWEEQPADAIAETIQAQAQPGAVVLMHDGLSSDIRDGSRQRTVQAVQLLLPRLQAEGYRLVTVSELLGWPGQPAGLSTT